MTTIWLYTATEFVGRLIGRPLSTLILYFMLAFLLGPTNILAKLFEIPSPVDRPAQISLPLNLPTEGEQTLNKDLDVWPLLVRLTFLRKSKSSTTGCRSAQPGMARLVRPISNSNAKKPGRAEARDRVFGG